MPERSILYALPATAKSIEVTQERWVKPKVTCHNSFQTKVHCKTGANGTCTPNGGKFECFEQF